MKTAPQFRHQHAMQRSRVHTRTGIIRAGFTLVEMLVSVALVLLIMTMFAQIFQLAAGSITTQQGIAENDQQARMISAIIRSDLDHRSMRFVFPFAANEDTSRREALLSLRRGYFYYAENNPYDKTDDVLQFTTLVSSKQQSRVDDPYTIASERVSAAVNLPIIQISSGNPYSFTFQDAGGAVAAELAIGQSLCVFASPDGLNDEKYIIRDFNADGTQTTVIVTTPVSATAAPYGRISFCECSQATPSTTPDLSIDAEVSYFLRGGNLYRRVLHLRDGGTLEEAQPKYSNGNRIIPGNYLTGPSFWRDYDYSAFHYPGKNAGNVGAGVMFHAAGASLYNGIDGERLVSNDTVPANVQTFPVSLGIPHFRFGHNPETGIPREYFNLNGTPNLLTDDTAFIGRFLTQETSSVNFGYPGYRPGPFGTLVAGTQNPYARQLTATSGLPHVIDEYEDSPPMRRGEDLLMSNVLAFDVKLLDPILQDFVDVGAPVASPAAMAFHPNNRLNTYYAQDGRYRFDTWHPSARIIDPVSNNPADVNPNPPFRPVDANNRPLPVTAIQITIVYQSRVDGRPRQVTIVHSLQDRIEKASF